MKNKKLLLSVGIGALVLVLVGGLVANNSGLFQGKVRGVGTVQPVQPTRLIFEDATPDEPLVTITINQCNASWKKIAEWNAWIGVGINNSNNLANYVPANSSKTLNLTQISTQTLKNNSGGFIDDYENFSFNDPVTQIIEDYKLVIKNTAGSTLFEKIVDNNTFGSDATFTSPAGLSLRGGQEYRISLYARNFNLEAYSNILDSQIIEVKNKTQSLDFRSFGIERPQFYNDINYSYSNPSELCPIN